MKHVVLLFILLSGCASQPEEKFFTGELYFSPIRFGSFYQLPDSIQKVMALSMDTINYDRADSNSRAFMDMFNKIKKEGLLYKPYVDLRIDSNSYAKLYLDSADYDKIKIYKRQSLQYSHKKIVIKAKTRDIGYLDVPLLYCTSLVDVKVVYGETLPYGNKFRISDYD